MHNGSPKYYNITLLVCIFNIIAVPTIVIITGYIPEMAFAELTIILIAFLTIISLLYATCEIFQAYIIPRPVILFQTTPCLIYCAIFLFDSVIPHQNKGRLWLINCLLSILASILLGIDIHIIEQCRSIIDKS
jgi:hypothetical protein